MNRYYLTPETQAALLAESQRRREALAAKRATRFIERRTEERRSDIFDRRVGDRRVIRPASDLRPEANLLTRAAFVASIKRFDDNAVHSAFASLGAR